MESETKGTRSVNAIELLEMQHREVEDLFEKFEASEDDDECEQLFNTIADKLAIHATIEEKVFYPACLAAQTEDILLESVEEHLQIKRLLADLITMNVTDDEFEAKLHVLKEQVTHHAHKEEEAKLFPEVKSLLTRDERAALGNEVLVMFDELMQSGHPYKDVPAQIEHAAPLPHR